MSKDERLASEGSPLSRRKFFSAALALTLGLGSLAGLAACGQAQQNDQRQAAGTQEAKRSFTDSVGRTVELPAEVSRVVVTGPVAQQVMVGFDSGKLVGLAAKVSDSQYDYLDSSLKGLPILGNLYGTRGDINKEAVAAATPDLVIDIGEAKKTISEDMDSLQEALGVPCIHIESSLDAYDKVYKMLGQALGEEERGEELAKYARTTYDSVKKVVDAIPEDQRPTVAYLLGDDGLHAVAKGSPQAAVVDLVANNAMALDEPSASGMGQEVSLEQIASFNPQMIVFGPEGFYGSVADDTAWAGIEAVSTGAYYQAPGAPYNWLSSPSSCNQLLGLQWFARLCYPSKFTNSAADAAKEFFKLFYHHDLTDGELSTLLDGATAK